VLARSSSPPPRARRRTTIGQHRAERPHCADDSIRHIPSDGGRRTGLHCWLWLPLPFLSRRIRSILPFSPPPRASRHSRRGVLRATAGGYRGLTTGEGRWRTLLAWPYQTTSRSGRTTAQNTTGACFGLGVGGRLRGFCSAACRASARRVRRVLFDAGLSTAACRSAAATCAALPLPAGDAASRRRISAAYAV